MSVVSQLLECFFCILMGFGSRREGETPPAVVPVVSIGYMVTRREDCNSNKSWHHCMMFDHFLDYIFHIASRANLNCVCYTDHLPLLGQKYNWIVLYWYWDCFCSLTISIIIRRCFLSIWLNYWRKYLHGKIILECF